MVITLPIPTRSNDVRSLQRPEMTRAMLASDASYDGLFITAVRTTGVFCRPSCRARKPRPDNVEFFSDARQAMLAGYRPCKRCRPMETDGRPPAWVRGLLTRVDAAPSDRLRDQDLRDLRVDPVRVRRWFKQHFGMTFQAYHRSKRMGMALAEVRRGDGVTAVGMRHGFESASGFRDAFEKVFGKPPGRARAEDCVAVAWRPSPVGALLLGATTEGLCFLEFTDRRAIEKQIQTLRRRLELPIVPGKNKHLDQMTDELTAYFEGRLTRFKTPLILAGSPFQLAVWERLQAIPYGETISYDRLARDIGRAGAQRAVGRANGDNRIAIVIPCHRVVRASGEVGGYGGGVWRKQYLLDLERGAGLFARPAGGNGRR